MCCRAGASRVLAARSWRSSSKPKATRNTRKRPSEMAEVAVIKTAAEQQLAARWQEAKSHLPGPVLLRATAFERFAAAGLPHRRVEEWKYTDLRALMRDAKPLAAAPDAAAKARAREAGAALVSIEARRTVFVD